MMTDSNTKRNDRDLKESVPRKNRRRSSLRREHLQYPEPSAVWLVMNTALSFEQIAGACNMHQLDVQAIADGERANGIIPCNPITTGEITKEDIIKCSQDPSLQLSIKSYKKRSVSKRVSASKSKRQAKPDAVLWLLKNYPELSTSQIVNLIGTTPKIVNTIQNSTHKNFTKIKPRDPVLMKLCTEEDIQNLIMQVKIAEEGERKIHKIISNINNQKTPYK
ncbi:MAG: hypothetical protein P857_170 [Candidatus Xenolissoclinum pacificiensis L6]|uniref:Cytoplasmic protein n=1 Tax=Candidatus Xenolissoclinum pacificiensis L6 TaxID=1401685 RepID=W2V1H8_9RICK|nr:MAG: hypothetical protein P857_170 [Candidatus Xenolissoclinum pacificiensis L6]